MVNPRRLSFYIWLFSLLPIVGFLATIGFIYFNTHQVNKYLENLETAQEKIFDSSPSFYESDKTLIRRESHQVEHTLNSLQTSLVVVAIAETILILVSTYYMVKFIKQRVREVGSEITSSASQIAVSMEEQERMVNQQALSVNQTTTTIDELGASSKATAQQTENVADAVQNTLHLAAGGEKTVSKTLAGMSVLKDKVEAIAQQIIRLNQQTSQIGNIAGLVGDLANQTNMLSLNAAVEAVRAGEHGKGFAVVASEIRKLADQSQKSTERINNLVADIQMAINSTVMVTEAGTKTVEEGVKIAQETAEAFQGMSAEINQIWMNTQQISLSATQQALAVQQVVDAMNALNQVAAHTAESITQVKIGTQQLNQAAQKLNTLS